jgi:hypothetical protein
MKAEQVSVPLPADLREYVQPGGGGGSIRCVGDPATCGRGGGAGGHARAHAHAIRRTRWR